MNDKKKDITFYEFYQPPLESGDYLVSVSQQVAGTGPHPFNQQFDTHLSFAVQGIRFSLSPNYVQTVFPPSSAQGEFGSVLPHVVLTAKTLPWQRDLGIANQTEEDSLTYPWLAVLVFDEGDPAPKIHSGSLKDLSDLPSGTLSYPGFTLEYGQHETDPCRYIDVPADLFTAIAPLSTEMQWLSSARLVSKVATQARVTDGVDTPLGESAVVAGNRLAVAGHKTTCCLVSLENMGEYLPDRTGLPTGTAALRLVVLTQWFFSSVAQPVTFRQYFEDLNHTPATLQIPYAMASGTANESVKKALELGYTILPYHTRQGGDIYSWYRGPFLPFTTEQTMTVPIPSQDALISYDPENGITDLSLSAAWQLGRLLALNDLGFSTTLYNWKQSQDQAAVNAFEQDFLSAGFQLASGRQRLHQSDFHQKLINEAVKPLLARFTEKYKK
ncbi:hypothetical protein [Arachidicoccus terrestris]|uniref:hypothetical protein n=1 Tax=Arachidicoccus terrestris TaxID=2875539 RepID=UPI001CC63079|nr:hypothetical protein [Arachidicoccus terrestris]UAY54338.1 hypothetical protein K9M52_12850 [Arachidicoccus terrestris]